MQTHKPLVPRVISSWWEGGSWGRGLRLSSLSQNDTAMSFPDSDPSDVGVPPRAVPKKSRMPQQSWGPWGPRSTAGYFHPENVSRRPHFAHTAHSRRQYLRSLCAPGAAEGARDTPRNKAESDPCLCGAASKPPALPILCPLGRGWILSLGA